VRITNISWYENSILHIARHGVSPEEVEEVCFSRSAKIEKGRGIFHYITGQTDSGRYLFIVVKFLKHGQAKIITARDMIVREKTRYKRRR
jgi:uncharacterized DUF497 family protein